MPPYEYFALVFGVALVGALLLVPVAQRIGVRLGFVDQPRPNELQTRPVARTGGYAIIAAFAAAILVSLPVFPRFVDEERKLLGFAIGALLSLPLAYIDDARRLGPLPQFLGQVLIASVAMSFGLMIHSVANPFGGLITFPLYIAVPITLFWFLGMINTLNFIDSIDGLAAGVTVIASAALFIRTYDLGQYSIAFLPLALGAACLGFLPYNLNPARVIMGTSGSMFLGYALAVLAIIGGAKLGTTLMVMSVPIIDTALVIARRVMSGRSPFQGGDGAHLPHRMIAFGLGKPAVVLILYTCTLVLGYLASSLTGIYKLYAFTGLIILVAVAVLSIAYRSRSDQDRRLM